MEHPVKMQNSSIPQKCNEIRASENFDCISVILPTYGYGIFTDDWYYADSIYLYIICVFTYTTWWILTWFHISYHMVSWTLPRPYSWQVQNPKLKMIRAIKICCLKNLVFSIRTSNSRQYCLSLENFWMSNFITY